MGQITPGEKPSLATFAARVVSIVTFPPVLALPAFLLLIASFAGSGSRWAIIGIALTFGVLWPVAATVGLTLQRKGEGIERPHERMILLGMGVLGYAIGTVGLLAAGASLLVTLLMFCYGTNTAVLLVINIFWKASAHAMGVAGPTMALVFGFGVSGTLLSLLLPMVGWSRIRLGAHSLTQVVAGALLGYALTGLQLSAGLRLF
ncbi:MAG: phosphatase PAP2 family protein [Thermoplasmata archaeon]